jgi:hypothetical protein
MTFEPASQDFPTKLKLLPRRTIRNSSHPSLQFKKIHSEENLYSIRIGKGWRALGLMEKGSIYWFWIGSHADYDQLIK